MQVHLIYIHGFQGNDTSFQSFPTDLQAHVSTTLTSLNPGITIRTSLYPTYKSAKPLSFATRNFLEWLSTQSPGPVILLGHSMGGLLAAEAATDVSNNPDPFPGSKPRRIVGVVAFDTPYLGMHPHVVISGMASLLPKEENGKKKTASQMNDDSLVDIVDAKVTDDWEAYKKHFYGPSPPNIEPMPPSRSQLSFIDRTRDFLSSHSNDPIVLWARKHSDAPFSAGKQWLLDRFQFGACMFDPRGLKTRYTRLVVWNGFWVNYWTQAVPKSSIDDGDDSDASGARLRAGVDTLDDGDAVAHLSRVENLSISSDSDSIASASSQGTQSNGGTPGVGKRKVKEGKTSAHHFAVLPRAALGRVLGGSEKWENVPIGGVEHEVAAHCGLFIRGQNLDYDGLVHRVGEKVLGWCQEICHWDN